AGLVRARRLHSSRHHDGQEPHPHAGARHMTRDVRTTRTGFLSGSYFSSRGVFSSLGVLLSLGAACQSAPPTPPAATPAAAAREYPAIGSVERLDPALDALVAPDAKIEKLADGFTWAEGPVWTKEGALLFSDVPNNVIHRWKDGE